VNVLLAGRTVGSQSPDNYELIARISRKGEDRLWRLRATGDADNASTSEAAVIQRFYDGVRVIAHPSTQLRVLGL
jgi:hypothetical protein